MPEPGDTPLEIPALHELEMVSPWFDASTPVTGGDNPQRRLLLLLSIPRSGSYHLCRLLWHLGYGKPTEYFNPSLQPHFCRFHPRPPQRHQRLANRLRRVLNRRQPSRAWLRQLVDERTAASAITGQAFFSCKLQPDQLPPLQETLERIFAPLAAQGYWPPFSDTPPALVLLYRRNWKAMVLSHHLARCTGSFDQGRIHTHQHRPIAQLGDGEALRADLASGRHDLEALVATLQTSPYPIHLIAFEDLLNKQAESLANLIQQVDPAAPTWECLITNPRLHVRIARTPDPWASETDQWRRRLQQRFSQEGLCRHADAQACATLIRQLNQYNTLSNARQASPCDTDNA